MPDELKVHYGTLDRRFLFIERGELGRSTGWIASDTACNTSFISSNRFDSIKGPRRESEIDSPFV